MNKNKGIWLVIAAILIIGIAVTFATSSFVNGSRDSFHSSSEAQELTADSGSGQKTGGSEFAQSPLSGDRPEASAYKPAGGKAPGNKLPEGRAAGDGGKGAGDRGSVSGGNDAAGQSGLYLRNIPEVATSSVAMGPAPNQRTAGRTADYGGSQAGPAEGGGGPAYGEPASVDRAGGPGASEAAAVISPIKSGGQAAYQDAEEKKTYYYRILSDLDAQIQNMRSESSDSTAYSMKTMADKELKLWNAEMNMLYADILNAADEDTKEKLEGSQQEWVKGRDAKAEAASKRYGRGSLEGVEYTASLAESTRQRTYELVDGYIDLLPSG